MSKLLSKLFGRLNHKFATVLYSLDTTYTNELKMVKSFCPSACFISETTWLICVKFIAGVYTKCSWVSLILERTSEL